MEHHRKESRKLPSLTHRRSHNHRISRTYLSDSNKRTVSSRSLVRLNSNEKLTAIGHHRTYSTSSAVSSAATAASDGTSMQAFNFNLNPVFIKNRSILSLSKCEVIYRVDKDRLYLQQHNKSGVNGRTPLFQIISPKTTPSSTCKKNSHSNCCSFFDLHCTNDSLPYPYFNGKRPLDYLKFFKKITTKGRPSDKDVVFGNAKKFLTHARGWERSRIQWLYDLERCQEAHKLLWRNKCENAENIELIDLCCFPFFNNKQILSEEKTYNQ